MPTMTTTTPTSISGMVAVSKGSKVKALGYICFYSIPDRPVNVRELKKQWLMAGLDPEPLPKDPRALYLFKRACRAMKGKVKLADGTIVQTEVVDVVETGDVCVYQISRVVRDRDNQLVEYPKAMKVTYTKSSEEIHFDALIEKGSPVKRADLLPMMSAIQDDFENNAKMISGRKVRGLVVGFLKDDADEQSGKVGLSGENLRGKAGGVYFVAAQHAEDLENLAKALSKLYAEDGGVYGLSTVPLADGKSEREMIRAHHIANSIAETKQAIADVAKLLRDDRKAAVRSDVYAHHYRKLQALRRRVAAYEALLRDDEEEVTDILEMLDKQLKKLSGASA